MSAEARIMRTYGCRHCGVPAGQPCMTRSGKRSAAEHNDRWEQAVADGRLPLPRGRFV